MANGPLVHVIMPTYNGFDQIAHGDQFSAEPVLAANKFIIVDDGSDEDHFRILETLCEESERITLLRLPYNEGAYPARNAGFRASRG